MGCCQSSSANSATHGDASSAEIIARLPPAFRNDGVDHLALNVHGAGGRDNSARHPSATAASATAHGAYPPNNRIRSPSPVLRSPRNVSPQQPPWTRAHLLRQREIFFETRVAGRTEVWDAIRAAAALLTRGHRADAQALLDAACITCPTGRVAKGRAARDRVRGGLYDDRGRLYEVPDWILRDPEDIIEGPDDATTRDAISGDLTDEKDLAAAVDAEDDEQDEDADEADIAAGGKGKGRAADAGEPMRIRVRFSTGAPDVEVSVGMNQPVSVLLGLLATHVGADRRVRLVYLGKILESGKSLAAHGWKAGDVLSALVAEPESEIPEKRVETKGQKRRAR